MKLSLVVPLLKTESQLNFKKGTLENLFLSARQASVRNNIIAQLLRETNLEDEIFTLNGSKFNVLKGKIFSFQCNHIQEYQKWVSFNVPKPQDVPYLPIAFFKNHKIGIENANPSLFFESSSTTGEGISKHGVPFPDFYTRNFTLGFELEYGSPKDYCILALLPSYLERQNSSLVYMAEHLISQSAPGSGFYLYNHDALLEQIVKNEQIGQKTLLLGVTYALLDLAERYAGPALQNCVIMETGGMKGRRAELTRMEVHEILCTSFGVQQIHSEYGMTELMSQAWSKGDGVFHCPPWMQVQIVDVNDAGFSLPVGKTGRICVIDLGNLYSCSFIATDDLGKLHTDGSFEVLGRLDFSDTRGCNLMV